MQAGLPDRVGRRLAAADAVGYGQLTEADERGTCVSIAPLPIRALPRMVGESSRPPTTAC